MVRTAEANAPNDPKWHDCGAGVETIELGVVAGDGVRRGDSQMGKWSEVNRSMVRPPCRREETKQRKQTKERAG